MEPGQILAKNVRLIRRVLDLSQGDLAERMTKYGWHRQTVGELERGRRKVYVDELLGLTVALDSPLTMLLDPDLVSSGLGRRNDLPDGRGGWLVSLEVADPLDAETAEIVNEAGGAGKSGSPAGAVSAKTLE